MAIPALVRYAWRYNDPKKMKAYLRWAVVFLGVGAGLTLAGLAIRSIPLLAVGIPVILGGSGFLLLLALVARPATGWGGLWVRQVPSSPEETFRRLEEAMVRAGLTCEKGIQRPTRKWLRQAIAAYEVHGLARVWILRGLPRMFGSPQKWERAFSTLVIEPSENAERPDLGRVRAALDEEWPSLQDPRIRTL